MWLNLNKHIKRKFMNSRINLQGLFVLTIVTWAMQMYRQSSVKTNQLENNPSNNTFHILPFTHDNPG